MTPPDSPKSQPQTPEQALATQGLHAVVRATRVKTTATTQHGADRQLVGANQQQERVDNQRFHCGNTDRRLNSVSISLRQAFRCSLSLAITPLTGRVSLRMRSQGGISVTIKRKASRPCRLIALRNDAVRASRFGTINPRRARLSARTGQ